ncbi:hypothetical protein G6O69_21740 [Pseudenhygromyxa sp. WMMC2535]|uniref:hypothetical protein n=1 Tax=Pseudenhygromyxa sp. WMMC2535 TaxID=2712867 RepID=UPI0015533EC2|nr:hypothetical protein [Pseudenhygromyxa sp. WMMC2535]NVB40478.1 hypothetical protein [Pseudenhygromyxa sp. WMMC2535]
MAKPEDQRGAGSGETSLARREGTDIAKLSPGEAWRGDEHGLRLQAAREAGLDASEVELELFTEGFKTGMTLDDPADHAIVLRGRTVLRERQLSKALRPTIRFLKLPADQLALRVHDGEFELRVARTVAEQGSPALDSAKTALKLWLGFGLLGLLAWNTLEIAWLSALLWGGALLGGAFVLRRGLVSGRAMLAARLITALAMLAQEEKLILPPARGGEGTR